MSIRERIPKRWWSLNNFKAMFAIHEIPEHLLTDNARYFMSHKFHNFTTEWKFTPFTSNLRYPQSNGFIEWMVQTLKNTMKKATQSNIGLPNGTSMLKSNSTWQPLAITSRNPIQEQVFQLYWTLMLQKTIRFRNKWMAKAGSNSSIPTETQKTFLN